MNSATPSVSNTNNGSTVNPSLFQMTLSPKGHCEDSVPAIGKIKIN